jgi:hypothetical protein
VMVCAACRRDFELFRAVHVATPVASRRRFQPIALAASVALLAGLGGMGVWSSLRTDGPEPQRSSTGQAELVTPASGTVVEMPVQLIWRRLSNASSYTAELLAPDGRLIEAWVTTDTSVSVPVTVTRAGAFAWWVRARMSDGTERRSPITRFEVR